MYTYLSLSNMQRTRLDVLNAFRIVSAVNNLHPHRHQELYAIIEQLIEKTIPLWDLSLDKAIKTTWYEESNDQPLRILCKGDLGQVQDLERGDGREHNDSDRVGGEGSNVDDGANVEQDDDDNDDFADLDNISYTTEQLVHRYIQPEPTVQVNLGHLTTGHSLCRSFENLQVIVKLANIHLTPEKPSYDGGSWHIEGQMVGEASPKSPQ